MSAHTYVKDNSQRTEDQNLRKRRRSNDLSDLFTLQSGNQIKRQKKVQYGKPDDYATQLGPDNEPITRGDESRLMDPPITVTDDLYWLRSDERDDLDVLDLVSQLNTSYEEHMDRNSIKQFEEEIFQDMKKRVAEDEDQYPRKFYSTPYEDFIRMEEGKGHPIYCRRHIQTGEEIVLVDVNEYVQGVENPDTCDVTNVTTSFDCNYLSYCVDLTGDEKYELYIQDLRTGDMIRHNVPTLIYGFYFWAPDSLGLFHFGFDQAERIHQVYYHSLETGVSSLLYEESDTLFQVDVSLSKSLNYVLIGTSSMDTTEYRFCSTQDDYSDPESYRMIRPRVTGIKYYPETVTSQSVFVTANGADITTRPEFMVIRTNADGASNFKIVSASFDAPDDWTDLIPYAPDRFIESIDTINNYVLVDYREDGYARVAYVYLGTEEKKKMTTITFENKFLDISDSNQNLPSTVCFRDSYNTDYASRNVYVSFESLIHPEKLIKLRLPTEYGESIPKAIVWEKTVPNYDVTLYDSRIIQVPTSDGEMVPVSIFYRKDSWDPSNPTAVPFYLYGYGAYGINMDTPFVPRLYSLVDRGYVYAIAHVRGSSSKGYGWYLDGKMKNKQNSFSDFIECARYLINNGWTRPELLSIEGRSAGGLLMGAVLTQAPELFNSVVMGVPFVDVLVTMSDSTIPLTTDEWVEWGNPNYAEDYEVMSAYSPMENIKRTFYPNTYITCGLTDPRVQYWEPVKFHLRLLENSEDSNDHLIRVDTDKGHFSNTDRYAKLREFAKQYAFVVCNAMKALE